MNFFGFKSMLSATRLIGAAFFLILFVAGCGDPATPVADPAPVAEKPTALGQEHATPSQKKVTFYVPDMSERLKLF